MSDDDLSGLSGTTGLGPGEKVPNQLRILAAQENLGNLLSVHRPTGLLAKVRWRNTRLYVYDQGLVLTSQDGARSRLFRVGQMRIRDLGAKSQSFLLVGAQGGLGIGLRQWSEPEALGRALRDWALTHPWS